MNIIITGASSGIGFHAAKLLGDRGHTIGAIARREEKLSQLVNEASNIVPLPADVTNPVAVQSAVDHFLTEHGEVAALINNAGMAIGTEPAYEADLAAWRSMIDVNCFGLTVVTHAVLPSMIEKKNGLIINLGSVAGTYAYRGGNVYGATKAFVRQFTMNLRTDVHGMGIRVTNIEPGTVGGSEFSVVRNRGDKVKADGVYAGWTPLDARDIADQIAWLIELPRHINVSAIETMAVGQTPAGFTIDRS